MSGDGPGKPVRILLADGQPLLRTGFRLACGAEGDLHVVAEAGDGVEAVELARRLQPDVAVLDIGLPRLDGLAATEAIVAARLPVRVLLLSSHDRDEHVLGAFRAGAGGVLARDVPAGDLVAAIRTVAAGEAVLAHHVLTRLLSRLADLLPAVRPPAPVLAGLTEREQEVLVHVARGQSNAEIATALSVSETTVKTHVRHLLTKLQLRDRVQAVILAYESGIVRPGG